MEGRRLAGDAARATASLATLRREMLPHLRAATLAAAAAAAAAARRTVAALADAANGRHDASAANAAAARDGHGEWRGLAERALQHVAPMAVLAPHCGEAAEAKARALLCLGKFVEAITCAQKEGLGGNREREMETDPRQHTDSGSGEPSGGGNGSGGGGEHWGEGGGGVNIGTGETGPELWRRVCLVLAYYAMGNLDKAAEVGARANSATTEDADTGAGTSLRVGAGAAEVEGLKELLAAAAAQDARRAEGNASFRAGKVGLH